MSSDRLQVRFEDFVVGQLIRDDDGYCFRYAEGWLAQSEAFPVSLQLPLDARTYRRPAERWFANLLPEGEARQHAARRLGVSEGNDWELLAALGRDCAGALRIAPAGEVEAEAAIELLDEDELVRTIEAGGALAHAFEVHGARLSLAGAQDKLPVVLTAEGAIALPKGRQASTHLLKLPNPAYPDLPQVEVFTLAVAAALGLDVVSAELRCVGTSTVAIVKRYDRWVDPAGRVRRLHQEDGCQALGFGPDRKYEMEGGPAFVECFGLVDEFSERVTRDLPELLRRFVANLLLGNADAHAKNFSLLRGRDGLLQLAPAYDLVCTLVWPNLASRLAQSVDGQFDAGQIGRKRWRKLSAELGVTPTWMLDLVQELSERFLPAVETALEAQASAGGESERVAVAAQEMKKRQRLLRRLLDD